MFLATAAYYVQAGIHQYQCSGWQKWPTYPSDTLLRAAPAHLRTLTDIHNNFLLINLQPTSRSPHGAFLIHIKTQIPSILRLDDVTTNINTFYQLISNTSVSSKNVA